MIAKLHKTEPSISFLQILKQVFTFIPCHFRALVSRVWWIALILLICGFAVLYFSSELSDFMRYLLLSGYFLLLCCAYSSTAVMICRYKLSSDYKLPNLHFRLVELKYMFGLLRFWLLMLLVIGSGVWSIMYISELSIALETMIILIFAIFFCMVTLIIMVANLQLALPAIVYQMPNSLHLVWKLGQGQRLQIFMGVMFLLLLIIFLSGAIVIFIPHELSFRIGAVFAGICLFFIDICWQTVFLSEVYQKLAK